MAIVKILHSETAGHVPSSLQAGQIAINSADGIIFWLDPDLVTIRNFSFKNPIAPTKIGTDNSTAVATTAFVQAAIAALVAGAPASLDTFNEIATALGGDATFSATVNAALANRLRVDTLQSLTGGQQTQAQTNIGLTNSIRSDVAQSFTVPQQTQARQNIYAAPFDALAYNGMQVNGGFLVSQDGPGPLTVSGSYAADLWNFGWGGAAAFSFASQTADVPPGFSNAIKITVTTGAATIGSGDYYNLQQTIEGYRFLRCGFGTANARSVSVAFWAKAHRTGTYTFMLRNGALSRSYLSAFTINSADTWEYKTITIPGDTAGTWTATNTGGCVVGIALAAGSTYVAASGSWMTGNLTGATGQINGVAASTDYFAMTGFIILPGIELPSAAASPLIQRLFMDDLALCQRYYEKTYPYGDVPGKAYGTAAPPGALITYIYVASGYPALPWFFKTTKRASPTVSIYSPYTGAAGMMRDQNGAIDVAAAAGPISLDSVVASGNGTSVGANNFATCHIVANARLP